MKKEEGIDTVQIIKDGVIQTVEKDENHHIPFRTVSFQQWISEEQVLAVPDLGDSLESFEARQRAGVQSYFNTLGERVYPVDPSTYTEAKDVVQRQVEHLTERIAAAQAQIAKDKKEDDDRKKEQEKERGLFEEFKQLKKG